MHRTHPIDRREGNTDAERSPRELHGYVLRIRRRIAQFDANLGPLTGARRIGPDVNLGLGIERFVGPVKYHGRPIELAEAADDLPPHAPLHVGDDFPAAQRDTGGR